MAPSRTSTSRLSPEIASLHSKYPSSPVSHLMNRSLAVRPDEVTHAKGLSLFLKDGREILDACGGAAVCLLGHGNEEVVDAMTAQARKVCYVHTQAYTTTAAEELANLVLEGSPYGLEKATFVGSGSEANDSAMKLARQYFYEKGEHQRLHFVVRKQTYHGATLGAMSLSTNVGRKIPYDGFSYPHVSSVSPAFPYRDQRADESAEDYCDRLVAELEAEFARVGPQNVIAFVAETMVGATTGCVAPPTGYFKAVRALCDKYGILLILDEVMCGTGRTGTYFAFEQEGVEPDITTVAKGLGGGYAAIAGVYIHKKVVDVLWQGSKAFAHGHTYQAHPVNCATALAVQRIIRRDGLVQRCSDLGQFLEKLLRNELRHRSVGDIRGRGLFWAVEFVRDRESKEPFHPDIGFAKRVQDEAFNKGVAVYLGSGTADGIRGDHVMLAPPFTVTKEQLQTVVKVLKDAIQLQEDLLSF
ncbi:aminotransferase [Paramyrothecium foliicola]|nr:aminotransferase [Paramyrothecium foliicola]